MLPSFVTYWYQYYIILFVSEYKLHAVFGLDETKNIQQVTADVNTSCAHRLQPIIKRKENKIRMNIIYFYMFAL